MAELVVTSLVEAELSDGLTSEVFEPKPGHTCASGGCWLAEVVVSDLESIDMLLPFVETPVVFAMVLVIVVLRETTLHCCL